MCFLETGTQSLAVREGFARDISDPRLTAEIRCLGLGTGADTGGESCRAGMGVIYLVR